MDAAGQIFNAIAGWLASQGISISLKNILIAAVVTPIFCGVVAFAVWDLLRNETPARTKRRASIRFRKDWYRSGVEHTPFLRAEGRAPWIFPPHIPVPRAATATPTVIDLRWRAALQLVDYIGGSMAPNILRTLVENIGDPGASVAELARLLGFDKDALLAGDPALRGAFADRLNAFSRLEQELGAVTPDVNRRILAALQAGHVTVIQDWALAVHYAKEAKDLLRLAADASPFSLSAIERLRVGIDLLATDLLRDRPGDPSSLLADAEKGRGTAQRFYVVAQELRSLVHQWNATDSAILELYDADPGLPGFGSERSNIDRLNDKYARLCDLIQRDMSLTATSLKGMLADLRAAVQEFQTVAQRISDSGYSGSRGGGSYDSRGGYARAPDEVELWVRFGFDRRPNLAELKAAYYDKVKTLHPDLQRTEEGKKRMHELFVQLQQDYAVAQALLEDVTAPASF